MDPVSVKLDPRATRTEAELVRDAFAEAGIPAEVGGGYEHRGTPQEGVGDEPEWIVYVVLGYSILRFLDGFLAAAGADAWEKVKSLAGRVAEARRSNPPWQGSIQIREPNGRETIVSMIPEPPSDDAWQVLFELDWSGLPEPEWMVVQWFERVGTWGAFEPSLTGEGASLYWDRRERQWLPWDQGQDIPDQR